MGGDVTYDNSFTTCYYLWDYLLWSLESHYNKTGIIVPFITTVGNHDIGIDGYSRAYSTENYDLKE